MCDCATFLCCLNNNNIFCLEYTCLIISILIVPLNLLGILIIKWNLIKFYCEILYSVNITISIFSIFIISLVVYSTKIGKIQSDDLYKPFTSISLLAVFIFLYLFLTYSLCSFQIFTDYLIIQNINYNIPPKEKDKLLNIIKSKETWIKLSISTVLPLILSFANILLWISLYYRINFRISCSFNKEIRKVLREQRNKNKQFKQLKESISINDINKEKDKDKKKEDLNNFVSIVIEKDRRHSRFISNGGIITKNDINQEINNDSNKNQTNKIFKNNNKGEADKEYNQSDIISSERIFEKSNNQIKS